MAAEAELDKVLLEISDHLGFLGYESEVKEGRLHPYLFLRHQLLPNFLLDVSGGVVFFKAVYGGSEMAKAERNELTLLLNEMNSQSTAIKFYADADGDIILEGYFPREYSKSAFAAYWAFVDRDLKLFLDGRINPFVN